MESQKWKKAKADVFWGEIAPCDHVVQIYENESIFMDSLAGFVGGGIRAGECVIIIATTAHLKALDQRLHDYGIRVDTLMDDDRFIPLDAEDTLSLFMVDGWPDEERFRQTVSGLISRGTNKGRRTRAFGEMVALLWARGMNGATVQLEHLWSRFCEEHQFSLFCAYPKTGFIRDINESIQTVCSCHNKLIGGEHSQLTDVQYTDMNQLEMVALAQ